MAKKVRKVTVAIEARNWSRIFRVCFTALVAPAMFFVIIATLLLTSHENPPIETFVIGTVLGVGMVGTWIIAYDDYKHGKQYGGFKKKVWKKMTIYEEK